MIYLIWAVISQRKTSKNSCGHQAPCDCGASVCGKRGSGNYSLGADFVSNYKIKILSVIKAAAFILLHHSNSAKRCKSVLSVRRNLSSLLFHHSFCRRCWWELENALTCMIASPTSAKSEEGNMGKNWPLWFLLPLFQLNSVENLIFYLSILIFCCSLELFRAGIASAWVTSVYHSHYHNREYVSPAIHCGYCG